MLRLTLLSLTFHNTFVLTNLLAPTFLSKTRFPPGHGHTCNPSTGPMGAWGPGIQGHPQLGDEGSLDYIRSCFRRKEQRKKQANKLFNKIWTRPRHSAVNTTVAENIMPSCHLHWVPSTSSVTTALTQTNHLILEFKSWAQKDFTNVPSCPLALQGPRWFNPRACTLHHHEEHPILKINITSKTKHKSV